MIAFIGLGNMGLPMAENLVRADREVIGFDVTPEALERAESRGVNSTPDLARAADEASVVITMLPSGRHLLDVYGDILDLVAPDGAGRDRARLLRGHQPYPQALGGPVVTNSAFSATYETILVSREDRVALVTLNRPKALNALNSQVMEDVTEAARLLDEDDGIGCIVITGSEKAFAAGADIREMSHKTYSEMVGSDFFAGWEALTRVRKPVIAAVAGFALGGGCELAMMCDLIIAADTAKFGQPEVKLGVIPGIGGSQRLTRAIGRAKAMDLCLTGRMIDASEAESAGLVARVVPADGLMTEAMSAAQTIASMSLPALRLIKEAVNRAEEISLAEGVRFERRAFHGLFGSHDQIEGMKAFLEKRAPDFAHR